jgi:hypothetical protein
MIYNFEVMFHHFKPYTFPLVGLVVKGGMQWKPYTLSLVGLVVNGGMQWKIVVAS